MRRILIFVLLSLTILSCAGQTGADDICFPVIRYNPETYLSDVDRAFSEPSAFGCLSADSEQLAEVDEDMIAFLSGQDAFVIRFTDDDEKRVPEFIGIRDKEKGYLKYLDLQKERYRYSLDAVIDDIYGSLDAYVATWPEDMRHLFYEDPQGLYTFPMELYAVNVVGYGNSTDPDNPVRYRAAVSYLRSSRQEWNDDSWVADSTEIVRHSEAVTGAYLHFTDVGRAKFGDNDANYFSAWVKERLTYPVEALESAATGRVTASFTIDMFGNLEDVRILRGLHPALDSVVVKVISSSPKWTPATDMVGNSYSVTYTLPVIFTPEMMESALISSQALRPTE